MENWPKRNSSWANENIDSINNDLNTEIKSNPNYMSEKVVIATETATGLENSTENAFSKKSLNEIGVSIKEATTLALLVLWLTNPPELPAFQDAIREYQKENWLSIDGKIWKDTYRSMEAGFNINPINTDDTAILEAETIAAPVITVETKDKEKITIDKQAVKADLESHTHMINNLTGDGKLDETDISTILSSEDDIKKTILVAQNEVFKGDKETDELLENLLESLLIVTEQYKNWLKINLIGENQKLIDFLNDVFPTFTKNCIEELEKENKELRAMTFEQLAKKLKEEWLEDSKKTRLINILSEKLKKENYIIKKLPEAWGTNLWIFPISWNQELDLWLDHYTKSRLGLRISLRDNDSYSEKPMDSIFYSVIDEFNLKKVDGSGWDFKDLKIDPNGFRTWQEGNKTELLKQLWEEREKLKNTMGQDLANEGIKEQNLIWIQKIELLEIHLSTPDAIDKKALTKTIAVSKAVESLSGLPGFDANKSKDIIKDLMNWDLWDALWNNLLMPVAVIAILLSIFTDIVPKFVKGASWAYITTVIGLKAVKGLGEYWYGVDSFMGDDSVDENPWSIGSRQKTGKIPNIFSTGSIGEIIKDKTTIIPGWVKQNQESKYKEALKNNFSENIWKSAYIDIKKFDIIFASTANDNTLSQKNISSLDTNPEKAISPSISALLYNKSITTAEIQIFFRILKAWKDDTNDKKIWDLFVVWNMEANTTVEKGSYFPLESDEFNKSIQELVDWLEWLPLWSQWFSEEELNGSPKAMVMKATSLHLNDWNSLEDTYKNITNKNVNAYYEAKSAMVSEYITRLNAITIDESKYPNSNTTKIIAKYTELKANYVTTSEVCSFITSAWYWVAWSLIWENWLLWWVAENFTTNWVELKTNSIDSIITKWNVIKTDLGNNKAIDDKTKNELTKALTETLNKLSSWQLELLLKTTFDGDLDKTTKTAEEAKIKEVINANPEIAKWKVKEINSKLAPLAKEKDDITAYIRNSFQVISEKDIQLLRLAKKSNDTTLQTLATTWAGYYESFKTNIKDFWSGIMGEITDLETSISGSSSLADLEKKRSELAKIKESVNKNPFTDVVGVNFFEIIETEVQKIDREFNIESYPKKSDFEWVNTKLVDKTKELMKTKLSFDDLWTVTTNTEYIGKLVSAEKELKPYKEFLNKLWDENTIAEYKDKIEAKKEEFVKALIVKVESAELDELKEYKEIIKIYFEKTWDKFLYVFNGKDYWFGKAVKNRVKKLVIDEIKSENDPEKLEELYNDYLEENKNIEWLVRYFKDLFESDWVKSAYESKKKELKKEDEAIELELKLSIILISKEQFEKLEVIKKLKKEEVIKNFLSIDENFPINWGSLLKILWIWKLNKSLQKHEVILEDAINDLIEYAKK